MAHNCEDNLIIKYNPVLKLHYALCTACSYFIKTVDDQPPSIIQDICQKLPGTDK
jgi:hypothetical protein